MYQCSSCNKQFMHTARRIEEGLTKEVKNGETTYNIIVNGSAEFSVCPFCQSKAYTEVAEEKQVGSINLADVASLIDCPPSEANTYLTQGYTLFQTWQKNVFLVKLKDKVAPKEGEVQ